MLETFIMAQIRSAPFQIVVNDWGNLLGQLLPKQQRQQKHGQQVGLMSLSFNSVFFYLAVL